MLTETEAVCLVLLFGILFIGLVNIAAIKDRKLTKSIEEDRRKYEGIYKR